MRPHSMSPAAIVTSVTLNRGHSFVKDTLGGSGDDGREVDVSELGGDVAKREPNLRELRRRNMVKTRQIEGDGMFGGGEPLCQRQRIRRRSRAG